MIRTCIIGTLALAALATTPAMAQEQVWATGDGYTVRTTGLDLATTAGRAGLLQRIEHAGRRACADVIPLVDRRGCESQALERALVRAAPAVRTAIAVARLEQENRQLAAR